MMLYLWILFGNLATLETIGQPKLGLLPSPLLFNGRKP